MGVGVNSDTVGQVCDDVGLHQLAEELLLLGYVVCPRLWENRERRQSQSDDKKTTHNGLIPKALLKLLKPGGFLLFLIDFLLYD